MSSKSELLLHQRIWAESRGLEPDSRGYLADVAANLFRPIHSKTKSAFDSGSGSELQDTPSRPAKMKALHSSSALAVNVFDSWVEGDKSALQAALQLDTAITAISFEAQYPTNLTGNPPNLDVTLELADGFTIGIESKFSEWLTPKSASKEPFKSKYFPGEDGLWKMNGLPKSQRLAVQMKVGARQFRYLDAAQLLKHALGMATQLGDRFSLFYIYLDWSGKESAMHAEEIDQFADLIDPELGFRVITYQQLFSCFKDTSDVDAEYLEYVSKRYGVS